MKKKREGLVTERDRYERESARVRASELFIETVRAIESERERQSQREKDREKPPVNFWSSTPECTRHYLRKAQDAVNHIEATPCV